MVESIRCSGKYEKTLVLLLLLLDNRLNEILKR